MTATHRDHHVERRQVERRPVRTWAALALAVSALLSADASAQQAAKPKKLYCWDEGGKRVCSDALPASAIGRQRTEFDTRTGATLNRVGRELTREEQVRAAAEEQTRLADEAQARREMAMVVSYQTEEDLERAFRNRFELIEESLKGSALALVNLHTSLVSLLRQANELELQSKPVGKALREKIRNQHAELQALRALKQRQESERKALDAEFKQALSRYRALKGQAANAATPAANPGG
jgi:hypothetical protein